MSARGKYQHRPVVYGPTPGPWSAGLTNTKIVVDDSRGGRLATLAIVPQSVHAAEGVATAVLMAEAPTLFTALEAALAEHDDTHGVDADPAHWSNVARSALQRARGEG